MASPSGKVASPGAPSASPGSGAPASAVGGDCAGGVAEIVEHLDRLRARVQSLDGYAAVALLTQLDEVLAVGEGVRLSAVSRVQRSEVWRDAANQTANSFLRARSIRDHGQAAKDLRAAELLDTYAVVRDAVDSGKVSRGHVDVVVSVGLANKVRERVLPQFLPSLMTYAALVPVADFRRTMRAWAAAVDPIGVGDNEADVFKRRYLRVSHLGDGVKLDGFLTPEVGSKAFAALNAALSQLWKNRDTEIADDRVMSSSEQERADAFEVLLDQLLAAEQLPTSGGAVPAVAMTVSLQRLEEPCCEGADPVSLLEQFDTNLAEQLAANRRTKVRRPSNSAGTAGATPTGATPDDATSGNATPAAGTVGARGVTGAGGVTGSRGITGRRVEINPDRLIPGQSASIGPSNGPGEFTLSPREARRMTCDCNIRRVIVDEPSLSLDVGRSRRIFPAHLRKALEIRDGGCVFPFCGKPASWSHAHHIKHWADGGVTSLNNAALLCSAHHHAVHADKHQIVIGDDGRARVDLNLAGQP
ncbi:MAG: DUF222 domain-containing protein [Candidatus Nanopelagicales bacterium]